MELFLLYLVAFLRPILFIEVGQTQLFDIGGIAIITVLFMLLLVRGALHKPLRFGAVDALIVTFVLWSVCVALIYPENLDVRELAKLIAPFFGYTVAKNILIERGQYQRMLGFMIVGFAVPVLLSAVLIKMGKGIDQFGANYWTGIVRWSGAYANSHNMGHSMAFLIMILGIYYVVGGGMVNSVGRARVSRVAMVGALGLALVAFYCLWMSQVRTALVGLIVFAAVYLAYANKAMLIGFASVCAVIVILLFPTLKPILLPDVVTAEKTGQRVEETIGSGRGGMWSDNLERFADLPVDRQLAGAGIGSKRSSGISDSHNDLLDLLLQTGLIGATIYLVLQLAILRRIRALPVPERYVFLAIFIAVFMMNFASNSYIARFGLAQMYYLVMAYIELNLTEVRNNDLLGVTART